MKMPMTFEDYQTQAGKTAIYNEADTIVYPALALASETGEVAGKISKVMRDNNSVFSPEKREEIADEVGDCLWNLSALCTDLGFGLEEVAQRNLDKLNSRLARGVLQGSGDNR